MSDDRPVTFPAQGTSTADLLAEIDELRGGDIDWRGGKAFSLVYNHGDEQLEELHHGVADRFLHENALNPFAYASLPRMEREVIAMAADLMGGSADAGSLTSGGTESIFLAVQVARDHAREAKGIDRPKLISADTAHPAFVKAATYLDVETVRLEVGADLRLDPAAVADAVDARTALLVASAPCYPYGTIDPVADIAALAAEHGILCHVDACLGGWMLPFWQELGEPVPPWNLQVEGVTSLSADVHKYGYAYKGASVLLHRSRDLLARQFFLFDDWPGGLYGSATTAGTRPGPPIAGAWATIRHLGREGYLRLARQVRDATHTVKGGIAAIDGIEVTGDPDLSVFQVSSSDHDMEAVADVMDDRGWNLDRQQGGLHVMLSPGHAAVADLLVADLAQAVATHGESRGKETAYGGVA